MEYFTNPLDIAGNLAICTLFGLLLALGANGWSFKKMRQNPLKTLLVFTLGFLAKLTKYFV